MTAQLDSGTAKPRAAYMVLSPHALPYARLALTTLLDRCVEPLHLTLITDSAADKIVLQQTLTGIPFRFGQTSAVFSEEELADSEAERFRDFPHIRALRHGHPCWRKITDPLLISTPGEEIVLLDPDLYFPNPFSFEPTPANGLLLMWQRPNCLLPPEVVQRALNARIPLARHVDIGVSHWRGNLDLGWLDWLINTLSAGQPLPRVMHVEAILWSAIAMHLGGGYLEPARWVCWRRTQGKRVRVKLGAGAELLASEPWDRMKCFHAGGEAKWWLESALRDRPATVHSQVSPGLIRPFVPLTANRYACEQGAKRLLGNLGYYRLFNARTS